MKIVDKNLDIALHTQLYQIIKDMIESKELVEGASLMPERELCKLQNISRMTVNKAIINNNIFLLPLALSKIKRLKI